MQRAGAWENAPESQPRVFRRRSATTAGNPEQIDQAEQDLRVISGDKLAIGIGRYADRAEMCRVLASWVEDEFRALQEGGSYQRQVDLDDRGMFPGTRAP